MFRVMATEGGDVSKALKAVLERVKAATAAREQAVSESCACEPRLVAVSKTKPKEMVIEAYAAGQRHFGENYIKELITKASDPEVLERCPQIRWHMIGPMQTNKAKKVLSVPHLHMLETVHSVKLATILDTTWAKLVQQAPMDRDQRLSVYVQVNTSNEPQKSGVSPAEVTQLTHHILHNCPALQLKGLMTIGAFDHDLARGPNPDFQALIGCRAAVCEAHDLPPGEVELSMGMSGDYEHAISVGSSNVRVGSQIFGARSKTT